MQDDNKPQVENSPVISAKMPEEGESLKRHHANGGAGGERAVKDKKSLIIGVTAGVLFIMVAGVLIAVGINNKPRNAVDIEYSIERNPETGERPLFGTDPEKDNSGEAYVKYLQRVINASDTTDAERFDAYTSMAVYYSAVKDYDKAVEAMSTISADGLSNSQKERYYDVLAKIYEGKGDTAKAEEYRNMINYNDISEQ